VVREVESFPIDARLRVKCLAFQAFHTASAKSTSTKYSVLKN
jgi:hypothetical protein